MCVPSAFHDVQKNCILAENVIINNIYLGPKLFKVENIENLIKVEYR